MIKNQRVALFDDVYRQINFEKLSIFVVGIDDRASTRAHAFLLHVIERVRALHVSGWMSSDYFNTHMSLSYSKNVLMSAARVALMNNNERLHC